MTNPGRFCVPIIKVPLDQMDSAWALELSDKLNSGEEIELKQEGTTERQHSIWGE